jgi:hypothetical protein
MRLYDESKKKQKEKRIFKVPSMKENGEIFRVLREKVPKQNQIDINLIIEMITISKMSHKRNGIHSGHIKRIFARSYNI